MAEPTRMHVGVPVSGPEPAEGYDVVVGRGLLDEVSAMLGDRSAQVAVCYPETLPQFAQAVIDRLGDRKVLRLELPAGESAKTGAVAMDCWATLGAAGFTRSDAVVTVGGGATADLGGFVAATWLRGVRVVHVPTTLLGMVDAAVGGKTGINTDAGKNLVGAFHEPAGVVCDLDLLASLPQPELVSGLGEVMKCGFIADPEILALVDASPAAARDPQSTELRELVERAIAVKIAVVVDDFRETGGRGGHPGREALNYGHTLAHAVERVSGYRVRHGEAVALGMVFVAELARTVGRIDADLAARHSSALAAVGLPVTLASAGLPDLDFDSLLAVMRVDKKARGAQLRFVVLDELARPAILTGPAEAELRAAYHVLEGSP